MPQMLWPLLVVGAIAIAVVIVKQVLAKSGEAAGADRAGAAEALPYEKRRWLFSKAEKSFYLVLRDCVPDGYVLFAKVRLADVLSVASGTTSRQSHVNRIDRKHVDFLLCDQQWLEPRLAIELDDRSHERQERRERDSFLEQASAAAGLKLLRVPARGAYDQRELRAALADALGSRAVQQVV